MANKKVMNVKLRFQNKVTLTAIVLAVIALVYQVMAMFDVVPRISQNEITDTCGMIINLFVLLGIVVDPTTKGINDSTSALLRTEPK